MKEAKDFFNQEDYDRLVKEGVTDFAPYSSLPVPDDPDVTAASKTPRVTSTIPTASQTPSQRGGISRRDFFWGGIVLGAAAIGGLAYLSNREQAPPIPSSSTKSAVAPTIQPAVSRSTIASPSPSPELRSSEQPVAKTHPVYRLITIHDSADIALTTVDLLRNNMVRFNVLTSKRTSDAFIQCNSNNNDQEVYINLNNRRVYPVETLCTSRRGQLILAWGSGQGRSSLYSWAVFSGNDIDLSRDMSFKWYNFGEIENLNVSSPKTKPPDSVPTLNSNQTLKVDHVWAMLEPQLEQNWGNDWDKVNIMLTQFMKAYPRPFYERDVSPINRVAQDKFLTAKYEYINKLLNEQRPDEAKIQFTEGSRVVPYFNRAYWDKVLTSLDAYWGKDWAGFVRILRDYLYLENRHSVAEGKLAVGLLEWGKQSAKEGKCQEAADKFEEIAKLSWSTYAAASVELQKLPCRTTR